MTEFVCLCFVFVFVDIYTQMCIMIYLCCSRVLIGLGV